MQEPYETLFAGLWAEVRSALAKSPKCHDWDHTVRVWRNARFLAREEGAREAVVEYAAVLHDIGRSDEFADQGKTCHAERGAREVPHILARVGVKDAQFIAEVAECVRTHRYRRRGGRPPATLEARILFDADKLDAIGAIGVGRAFHFAGHVGARVHNEEREALAAAEYSVEDSAYREFLVKLRHVRQAMLTDAGRRIAEGRHQFMCAFFERLKDETTGAGS